MKRKTGKNKLRLFLTFVKNYKTVIGLIGVLGGVEFALLKSFSEFLPPIYSSETTSLSSTETISLTILMQFFCLIAVFWWLIGKELVFIKKIASLFFTITVLVLFSYVYLTNVFVVNAGSPLDKEQQDDRMAKPFHAEEDDHRTVVGFILNPLISAHCRTQYTYDCTNANILSKYGIEAWSPWSVEVIRLSLFVTWIGFWCGFTSFIGAFLSFLRDF